MYNVAILGLGQIAYSMDEDPRKTIVPLLPHADSLMLSTCMNNSSWKPEYTLNSGLSEIIDWFQENGRFIKSDLYYV